MKMSHLNKVFIIVLVLFCSFKLGEAQELKRGNNWVLGFAPAVIFNFNSSLVVDTFQQIDGANSTSSISDTNGNLLFFSTGFNIGDKDGFLMQNGANVNCPKGTVLADYYGGSSLFTQTSIILPKKGNTYYVFSTGMSDSVANNYLSHTLTEFDVLNYSVVDMDGNMGKGSVIEKNKMVMDHQHYVNCALTAVKHSNGKDWWLVKADCNNNRYQLFCVKKDTIIGPFFQYSYDTMIYCHAQGQIYFNQDGSRLISSIYGGKYTDSISCSNLANNSKYMVGNTIYVPNRVDEYEFDRCNGTMTFSNYFVVPYDTGSYSLYDDKRGINFSPNGTLIYLSSFFSVYQIDISDTNKNNGVLISGPDTTIAYFPKYSSLGSAPNGSIYIGNWNGSRKYMSYIDSPNVKGLGCHFVANGVWQPYTNLLDPPNMPFFGLGIDSANLGCWSVGIDEIKTEVNFQFSIYPNPSSSTLNIEWKQLRNEYSLLELYNNVGQIIYSTKLYLKEGSKQIDVSQLPNGLYHLRFKNCTRMFLVD